MTNNFSRPFFLSSKSVNQVNTLCKSDNTAKSLRNFNALVLLTILSFGQKRIK